MPPNRRVVQVPQTDLAHATTSADLHRARRGVDTEDFEAALLQVKSGAARSAAEIQHRASRHQREKLAFGWLPLLEGPEEPLRVHSGDNFAVIDLQLNSDIGLALEVVKKRPSPRVPYRPRGLGAVGGTMIRTWGGSTAG